MHVYIAEWLTAFRIGSIFGIMRVARFKCRSVEHEHLHLHSGYGCVYNENIWVMTNAKQGRGQRGRWRRGGTCLFNLYRCMWAVPMACGNGSPRVGGVMGGNGVYV
jgi:hypothetical protein